MSLTDNHIRAGLPAWATDEEAEQAAALGRETTTAAQPDRASEAQVRAGDWRRIGRSAIVGRAQAIQAGAMPLADQLKSIAREAERASDALTIAVMGVRIPPVPTNRLYDALQAMGEVSDVELAAAQAVCRSHDMAKAPRTPAHLAPKSIKVKSATTPERQRIQEYVRQQGGVPVSAMAGWLAEQGINERAARAMERAGQLVITRRGEYKA